MTTEKGQAMTTYIYREDGGYDERLLAADDEAAAARAEEMLREGDWHQAEAEKSFRVRAVIGRVITEPDGTEDVDGWQTVMVQFDPAEPPCPAGGHDWRDGIPGLGLGSFGNGGGVIVREACAACGAGRTTDTWATDPANGQPFESVAYQPCGRYDVAAA